MTATAWKRPTRSYGPGAAGLLMTAREFDRAEFVEGWRYELINGVLVVSSTPSLNERDPNQALGRWLLSYQEEHPDGSAPDFTIHEHTVVTGRNRRRADRVIWAGTPAQEERGSFRGGGVRFRRQAQPGPRL